MTDDPAETDPSFWEACANELAELRTECFLLSDVLEDLWNEVSRLGNEQPITEPQFSAATNDVLEKGLARLEARQQEFAAVFAELLKGQ